MVAEDRLRRLPFLSYARDTHWLPAGSDVAIKAPDSGVAKYSGAALACVQSIPAEMTHKSALPPIEANAIFCIERPSRKSTAYEIGYRLI
jgi:hypothetical protein